MIPSLISYSSPAQFERWRGHRRELYVKEHDSLIWSILFRSHQLTGHLGHDPVECSRSIDYQNMITLTRK